MKKVWLLALMFLSGVAVAQQTPPVSSALLDHLAGSWVLQGTIAGQPSTHDIDAKWVLEHHYLRVHKVSREKTEKGEPLYEAFIFIAWNDSPKQYSCAWLDVYGGFTPVSVGVAEVKDSDIPFVFKDEPGDVVFSNDFIYDAKTDTWQWIMDNVHKGATKPFGRVKLVRK
jgi:hypothetical protein